MTRAAAAEWADILAGEQATLRQRPRPDRWSALEYACHVRDVFALYDQRLELMLTKDGPRYANWNQDETAIEKRYGESDPVDVAAELAANADRGAGGTEPDFGATAPPSLSSRSPATSFTIRSTISMT